MQDETGTIPVVSVAELEKDPHQIYRSFRARCPFIKRENGTFLVLRADEIEQLYSDPRTRQVETEFLAIRNVTGGKLFELAKNGMLTSNGETHARRRAPIARAFAVRALDELRPTIRMRAQENLARRSKERVLDVVTEYAALLPAQTIAAILGLPLSDMPKLRQLAYTVSNVLSGVWVESDYPLMERAALELERYIVKLIEGRRKRPRDDFVTRYLQTVDADASCSELEAIAQLLTLIVAGTDTTRGAIAIQTSLLLQHYDQWQMVADNPSLAPKAVAECLRFEPVAGSVTRFTLADITVDGFTLPEKSVASLVTMSALRDETRYVDPDRFDITRQQSKWHPIFGGGEHRCLGEALAKVELEESLAVLAERVPNLRLADVPLRVTGHAGIRKIGELHVTWS